MEKKKYTPGQNVEQARDALENHKGQKPGDYVSQWQGTADKLLQDMQNRGPFQYEAGKDPNYRQAVDQYVRLGKKAMMDTVGKAAALTGGYGNSYALTAGQQTYGEYLQALMARLPQFQDMALKRYQAGGRDLMDRYQILSQREKDAYGRYQRAVEQYWAREKDLQSAYDREYDRDYNRYVNDRDYDYALDRDQAAEALRKEQAEKEQQRWEQDLQYQKDRDKIRDDQWEREFAESRRRYELEWAMKHAPSGGAGGGGGGTPSVNFSKYQSRHSLTEKEYDEKKKAAESHGHYGPRPSGSPWSPRPGNYHRPNLPVAIR